MLKTLEGMDSGQPLRLDQSGLLIHTNKSVCYIRDSLNNLHPKFGLKRMKLTRISLATFAVMTTLVLSGVSIPFAMANAPASAPVKFPSSAPTYVGSASAFLSSPILVSPTTAAAAAVPSAGSLLASYPNLKANVAANAKSTSTLPPTVNCLSSVSGCDTVSLSSGGASTQPYGINAYNNYLTMQAIGSPYGAIEPPDQGLCTGNGYVMQVENIGQVQVFNTALAPVSGVIPLDTIMGLTAKGWSSGGDIMCQYDYANGGHWFITQFVSASPESAGGTFAGCFAAVIDTCYEGIAVSVTNNPMGAYYVYFLNPNAVNSDMGVGYFLNDFTKTATTRDAFMLFYDEFPLTGGFNGAQEFAFSKNALEHGLSKVNVAYENMGAASSLYPIPANPPFQASPITQANCLSSPFDCWFSVIPAQTTDPTQYDNNNGGTGFMVATLDATVSQLAGDNRVAVFDWTDLSALNSPGCSACSGIAFGGQMLTGHVTYQDNNFAGQCLAEGYVSVSTTCALGAQKIGPTPLGDSCVANLGVTGVIQCPESGIETNSDQATDAFYSNGMVWTAVSTIVNQTFGTSPSEYHVGAAYWGITATDVKSGVHFSFAQQGIVTAAHEDMEMPAVASTKGSVLMTFTLSGPDFYPSTAFVMLTGPNVIHIADRGAGAQDGFTEYQGYSAIYGTLTTGPRWGDYNQAVYDPSTGKFYFATEMIQHQNCGDLAYSKDPTCGGTRAPSANWGNSLNSITP